MYIREEASGISDFGKPRQGLVLVGAQQDKSIMLVVEDKELARSVKLQLDVDGFKADMFTDPVLALKMYLHDPSEYSLVIADMKMVSISTFEFMREIKKGNPDSKILLITPFEIRTNEFAKVLPSSKVNGFVEKPLLSTKLISSVREILDLHNKEL